jgi:alpha-2-macroglobulin
MRRLMWVILSAALVLLAGLCAAFEPKKAPKPDVGLAASSDAVSLLPPEQPPAELAMSPVQAEASSSEPPAVSDALAVSRDPLQISFGGCGQAACPLSFVFSAPMVKPDQLATAPIPKVQLHPAQKGRFIWKSANELHFLPDPEALPWGHKIVVSIPRATPLAGAGLSKPWQQEFTVPFFQVAGKVASWPVVRGRPRLIALLNRASDQIGSGPLLLLYDQKVGLDRIKRRLTVTNSDGKTLATHLLHPSNLDYVLGDAELDLDVVVAVTVDRLPKDGESITVGVPDWKDGEPSSLESTLSVSTSFEVVSYRFDKVGDGEANNDAVGVGDGTSVTHKNRVPLAADLDLELSNAFEPSLLEKSVRIEPAAKAQSISGGGSHARVHLELEPGARYRIRIDRGFTDVLGNHPRRAFTLGFRSQDLPPQLVLPNLPLLIETDAASLEARGRNLAGIKAEVVPFTSPSAFAKALARGKKDTCTAYGADGRRQSVQSPSATKTINAVETLTLGLPKSPMQGCVQLHARGTGSEGAGEVRSAVLVQTSDIGITAKVASKSVLAWITRLSDARPVQRAKVVLLDERGARLGAATTDERGIATLETKVLGALKRPVMLVAEANGEAAVTPLVDDQLSQARQFGLKGEVPGARALSIALFTERGAYRPGETVHIKAIAPRASTADSDKLDLEVRDPRGQQVAKKLLSLDGFGGAALDVKIKDGAPVGEYVLHAKQADRLAVRHFRVEEYRVPTFTVEVRGTTPWKRGQPATAVITGKYLHGGTLDGRQVRWQLTREPQPFVLTALPDFVFGLGDPSSLAGGISSAEKRLDGSGRLQVSFTPDHPSSAGPMRYVVEATVTDVDRQAYAGRYAAVVHPAAFYLGLLPPSQKVLSAMETLKVPVVAASPDGKVLPGVKVRAQLERIDYHTSARVSGEHVQVSNRPVEIEQGQCVTTTKETPVTCSFKLAGAGQYRVRAWATDLDQRSVQSGFEVSVAGENPVAWPRFDQDRIGVIADRAAYKPGDVAHLVVQAPFKRAQGLLTLERDGVLDARVFRIEDNTPSIEVPIAPTYAPNVFASVVLLRGRVHHEKDATGFETGAPGFKIGYASLTVDAPERRLDVQVKAGRAVVNPGEKVAVQVNAKDASGAPRSAQATLMVVDEAVLGLTGYKTPQPLSQIYAEQPLGVRTGESRLDLPCARRSRHEAVFPGGDGEEEADTSNDRADVPREPKFDVRRVWKSTAYWNPKLELGVDGTATVMVDLPDNITSYRIMAVVSDREGRAGSAEDKITAKRPLMLQPVLPRFAYPQDELQIEALAFNGTATGGAVQVATKLEGLELVGGEATQTASVAPAASGSFRFKVRVTGLGGNQAVVRFAARLGAHKDAVEVKVPILSPGTRRIVVASRQVSSHGSLAITLPEDRLPGTAKLEVVASTTALSELKDAVNYLMEYPNGCIEQTTSTAYPLVVLKDLLPEIGVSVAEADLKKYSEAGVRRILSFQTSAGGLSYWPGGTEPHAFATAFGLTALIEAKKRGYDVPDTALARMADFLEASLRKGEITGEMPHGGMADADTRALFVMTLGRLGRPQPAYISTLWQKRSTLTPFGLSFLGVAATELAGNHALTTPILAEVKRAAKQSSEEAWYEGSPHGGWSFDSPLRTHAGALLAYASAENADGEITGKLLRGLLKRRQYGMWGNTQENVFGIMGVARLVGARTGGPSAPSLQITVGDKRADSGTLEKVSPRVRRLRLSESELGLKPGATQSIPVSLQGAGGPTFLTVRAEFEQALSAATRKPVSNGFRVERRYETMDGASLEGKPIPLGALLRVRLQVHADDKQNYVAIDDKLPAGLEPLNAALDTTEKVSSGALSPRVRRSLDLLSYSEIRDSRVAFFVDDMPAGDYEYSYVARATMAGAFLRPAGRAEAMYRPDITGTTAIDTVTVK